MLKRSRLIRVSFELALPCDATHEQVLEWLCFELHQRGGCDGTNPLTNYDLEAVYEPVLTDTHMHLHEEVAITREDSSGLYTTTTKSVRDEPSDRPSADDQRTLLLQEHYKNHKSA